MSKTNQGIIKSWLPDRGFGFIQTLNPDNSIDTFFCHIGSIVSGSPIVGQRAEFDVDYSGKRAGAYPRAVFVEVEPKKIAPEGVIRALAGGPVAQGDGDDRTVSHE